MHQGHGKNNLFYAGKVQFISKPLLYNIAKKQNRNCPEEGDPEPPLEILSHLFVMVAMFMPAKAKISPAAILPFV